MGVISSTKSFLFIKINEGNKNLILKYSKIFKIITIILVVFEIIFILYTYSIYSILKDEERYGDGGVLNSTKYDNELYRFIITSLLVLILLIIFINLIFSFLSGNSFRNILNKMGITK